MIVYLGAYIAIGVALFNAAASSGSEGAVFGINIIPHTWEATTLGRLQPGDAVNLEIDMLARYLARWQETA